MDFGKQIVINRVNKRMEFFSEHTELSTERAMREGRTNSERRESGVIPRTCAEHSRSKRQIF